MANYSDRFNGSKVFTGPIGVDSITDEAGSGAPDFPNGVSIEGTNTVIVSGTYTPTTSNLSNADAMSAAGSLMYTVIGDVVQVAGVLNVDPTALSSSVSGELTLPISRTDGNFTQSYQAAGVGSGAIATLATTRSTDGARITSVTGSERVRFQIPDGPTHTGNTSYSITFMYRLTN